jgi:hypothetical protein
MSRVFSYLLCDVFQREQALTAGRAKFDPVSSLSDDRLHRENRRRGSQR